MIGNQNKKKLNNNSNECINSYINITNYEYNGISYDTSQNGFLYDENNNTINNFKCELDKCLICPPRSFK